MKFSQSNSQINFIEKISIRFIYMYNIIIYNIKKIRLLVKQKIFLFKFY